ncbi:MAG: hypothetical protein LBH21_06540, partial [Gracilibacteraceae bacterium]|nr:hypothetical protein [Gracilibacteraceae bacterium]
DKRCDLLYLYLYDLYTRRPEPRTPAPLQYFATMQVLAGVWYAAAADCCALIRRHPLWGGDAAAFFAELPEPERTEFSETMAEATAGCLLAACAWQPGGRGLSEEAAPPPLAPPAAGPDPARFLRALAAVAPPALSDGIRLALGEEVEPARQEGSGPARRVGERLAALGAPEPARLIWREVLTCLA